LPPPVDDVVVEPELELESDVEVVVDVEPDVEDPCVAPPAELATLEVVEPLPPAPALSPHPVGSAATAANVRTIDVPYRIEAPFMVSAAP
jgi:hypothetical protein